MSGLIDAVVTRTPSGNAGEAIERFSEILAGAGITMRVRHDAHPTRGPAIRFEVRQLGNLSHLHIQALERILSRTNPFGGIVVVVNRGRRRFVLPDDVAACIKWFRDDRGSSDSGLVGRIWGRLRGS
jgi:hypothetical protein